MEPPQTEKVEKRLMTISAEGRAAAVEVHLIDGEIAYVWVKVNQGYVGPTGQTHANWTRIEYKDWPSFCELQVAVNQVWGEVKKELDKGDSDG